MGKSNFEDLQIFQLAEKLADIIWHIVIHWSFFEKETVGKQIIRAADSIGANIAEGAGRHNFQDNQRFVKIARGSLHETRYWLKRAYTRKLLTNEQLDRLEPIINDLSPKLNAYLKYLDKAAKTQKQNY
ncbi:MAG: four helix bundle protein [Fischerella sp.]|nr:four helix bundle protein [Fischerella sp.]